MSVSRIKILRETVARKIAAGEVIDRPFSILRELMDNAIDSGASQVQVAVENGGIGAVRVQDNGVGMSREDLELCWLPHATSKIETDEDLDRILTLGFRGEALAAIAASSRLKIVSSEGENGLAHQLLIHEGQNPLISPTAGPQGTLVSAEEIFYFTPARRRFLKSPASEGQLCKKVFVEKALAFPHLSFQYKVDGQLKFHLPPQTPLDRILALEGSEVNGKLVEPFQGQGEGFRVWGLSLSPAISQRDRSQIQIFVNKRKIQEFSLVQAVTHAYGEYLPGGRFPVAWVFLEVEPHLLDFNIHPAKREARFRNLPQIHSQLVKSVQERLKTEQIQYIPPQSGPVDRQETFITGWAPAGETSPSTTSTPFMYPSSQPTPQRQNGVAEEGLSFQEAYRQVIEEENETRAAPPQGPFRYLGQLMKLFLLVEIDDQLMLVDQHAAHERILYEKLILNAGKTQELLIPLEFTMESHQGLPVQELMDDLRKLGIGIKPAGKDQFVLTSIPQTFQAMASDVIELITRPRGSFRDLERNLFATLACRAAIMDGHELDAHTAQDLIRETLQLPHARCPHGRPIWKLFSRKDLYLQFGRLV